MVPRSWRATAKDPQQRYTSCGEFANALATSLAIVGPAGQVQTAYLPGAPRRRWPWIAAAMVAIVAVVAVAVVFVANGVSGRDADANEGGAVEWDDTLYPQEIESVTRMVAQDDLLDSMPVQPTPVWTIPLDGGRPNVLGGDDRIVLLASTRT